MQSRAHQAGDAAAAEIQRNVAMVKTQKEATKEKLVPHIPLPFEEVMKDVLKVKPPAKEAASERKPAK